jgi:glycosyltransferase involved in cell wall biosynthesis
MNLKEKFKIVEIVPALGWGGAQVFCIQLCNELANYPGYEVTLVSLYNHNQNHLPLSLLNEKVKFISLGKRKGTDLRLFTKVTKLLYQLQPNVVHTHLHAGHYNLYAAIKLKNKSVKKVHTFHNLAKMESPRWLMRRVNNYFFKKNIVTPVTISKEAYKTAVEEYGDSIKWLIHNGSVPVRASDKFEEVKAAINRLKKDEHTKVLLNIARISKQKNQKLLLDCMRTLQNEAENVIVLILGDCSADDKSLYDSLLQNKPSNVHFIGKVINVGDYVLNADAFVLSSLFEGLPIAFLETMSAGVIPVCTPVGGLVDIISSDIGFLSKDVSYESSLEALKKYLHADDATLRRMKNNCLELYKKEYSMESCAAKYNKLFLS